MDIIMTVTFFVSEYVSDIPQPWQFKSGNIGGLHVMSSR